MCLCIICICNCIESIIDTHKLNSNEDIMIVFFSSLHPKHWNDLNPWVFLFFFISFFVSFLLLLIYMV